MSSVLSAEKNVRIAMVSTHGYVSGRPRLGAADTGGQVVYVLEMSRELAGLGYDVDIWTRQFEGSPEIEVVSEGVRIVRVPCGGPDFIPKEFLVRAIPEWVENAMNRIADEGLHYEFINSHYWDGGVAGEALAKALGVPHVFTPHSLGVWKKRQMEADYPEDAAQFEAQYNFTERIDSEQNLFRDAYRTVATTPRQRDVLLDEYDVEPDSICMIPPGFAEERFFPVSEAVRSELRSRLGYRGIVVLAVGRLARNKGYDLLIDGFAVMVQRVPGAVLRLAVGGTTSTGIEDRLLNELKAQVVRKGLTGSVVFDSFLPDDELANHYRAADLFVLSSRYEPFGMTAIEAMACGTPTVLTLHGGLHSATSFGRHALIADPFDPEDLGITMAKVFQLSRMKSRLSRMGSQRVRELFTWEAVARQLVSEVRATAKAGSRSSIEHRGNPWAESTS